MKINELTKDAYTSSNIAKKQKAMAEKLQLRWARDKKIFAQQNNPISVVDYINRVLPIIKQVAPNFGFNVPNPSTRDEYNLIATALDIALQKTNYWQKQIEKSAGMEPTNYNAPAQSSAPTSSSSAPTSGTAPQSAPASAPAATSTPSPKSTRIPVGANVSYAGKMYKWVNNAWREANTGEKLSGNDAIAATDAYRNS